MQNINIFGVIKFGKLVKPECALASLHTFKIQTNIQCEVGMVMYTESMCTIGKQFVAHMAWHVLKAPSITFKTFTIAFGGLDGDTGLLKEPLRSGNCGFYSLTIFLKLTCLIKEHYHEPRYHEPR